MLLQIKDFRNYLRDIHFIRWGRVYTEKTKKGYRCKLYCVDWYHTDNFVISLPYNFKRLAYLKFGNKLDKVIIKNTSNKYSKHKLQDIIFYINK